MKRIFIAIKVNPGEKLERMISDIKSLLRSERIKWVDPGNNHLTLVFLGDTPESRIGQLSATIGNICSRFPEFGFNLAGTGVFRNYSDPKVIWAGINTSGQLEKLQSFITSGIKSIDFRVEERPFKPHLTIARIKSIIDKENLKSVINKYSDVNFQQVPVKEIILYESILKPEGPVYRKLESFPLSVDNLLEP
jgi:2'-5' RNA ligase